MLTGVRLFRVAAHLALGLCAGLAFGRLSQARRQAFVRWWARRLLAALGVRARFTGALARCPALIVANHVSWLDVIGLAAAQPAVFVCKSEIAGWPGIGWLAGRAGAVFIRRGSFRDVWRVNVELRARLAARQSIAAFPEGTTTGGRDVLAFRPGLFEPAVERGLPVYPVAIAYSSDAAAFVGETSFLRSLLAVAHARGLEVHVAMLRPICTRELKRRSAATQARNLIRARLALSSMRRSLRRDTGTSVAEAHGGEGWQKS